MDQAHNYRTPLFIVAYSVLICVLFFVLLAIVLVIRFRILQRKQRRNGRNMPASVESLNL